jgi:hypothetical protein
MKKLTVAFLCIGLLSTIPISMRARGRLPDDVVESLNCEAVPALLDENGQFIPVPETPLQWSDAAGPTILEVEGLIPQDSVLSDSESADVYLNFSDASVKTMTMMTSTGGAMSQMDVTWEPSLQEFVSIALVQPGSAMPVGMTILGLGSGCDSCGSNASHEYTARIEFKPAEDLYNGAEYVVVTSVNTEGVVLTTFASGNTDAIFAAWWPFSWWPFGGTPTTPTPPVGPPVAPPVVGGPAVLPPLPPGSALPAGMSGTLGSNYARIGLALAKMTAKASKCAFIDTQIALLSKCPTAATKPTLEAYLLWAAALAC